MGLEHLKPGVYAPVLTFFKEGSQDLDIDTFKAHVKYLAEACVGPVICGSMGEAPMLSEHERLELIKAARDIIDTHNLPVPLIVGTGLSSTRETIALTVKAAAAGADSVIVIPSGYYASLMSPAALKQFFIDVGHASPVPVIAYNFPGASGGVDMDSELLVEIAQEGANFCGAKLTCSQIGKITRLAGVASSKTFASNYPRSFPILDGQVPFVVFGGFADFLVPSLFAQAHGAIAGIGNFAPRVFRRLYELAQKALITGSASDLAEAQALQVLVGEADYATSALHIPGAKRILQETRGYGGLPRQPIQPVDNAFYQQVLEKSSVKKLLALERDLEAEATKVPSKSQADKQNTISPFDQSVVVTRDIPSDSELDEVITKAQCSAKTYKQTSLDERITIAEKFLDALATNKEQMSKDLSLQMGRPIAHCGVEVDGTIARGKHMIHLAKGALADSDNKASDTDTSDHIRYIMRAPVGVVLVVSPWNYPWFCQVNAVLPALLAGNAVLLKPSPQTPLCGEHFLSAYTAAGLPEGLLQILHLTPLQAERVVQDDRVDFVMFTGSVGVGHAIVKAASNSFKNVGLELGGKDPAYVREDSDLEKTVPALVDGTFFNAGQSCCSVERIYVHASKYDQFIKMFPKQVAQKYHIGHPSDSSTTLGPVVSRRSALAIRKQVTDAIAAGAKPLLPLDTTELRPDGPNTVSPQVLIDVNHTMSIMSDETFGPVVGIIKVQSDEEAVGLMNDSRYGLTASIWTDASSPASIEAFKEIVDQLETGTVYLNNCDNLDPALAWSGWKDSGRGVSLSKFGFDAYTRTKSVNIKIL